MSEPEPELAGREHTHNPRPLSPPCWCGWPFADAVERELGERADRATFQPSAAAVTESAAAADPLRGLPGWQSVWLRPVARPLAQCNATLHKPLAEITPEEVCSWVIVMGYAYCTGLLAGRVLSVVFRS
jgi:hypothetical protein